MPESTAGNSFIQQTRGTSWGERNKTTKIRALPIYQNFVEHIILCLPKSVLADEMKVVEFKIKADSPQ